MSTAPTKTDLVSRGQAKQAQWLLAASEAGGDVEHGDFPDRSVQVAGTFGLGASVDIEGSNDGQNWAVLTDPQGVALSFSSEGLRAITEVTKHIRPNVTGGDGTTALTITLFMRGDF